MRRNVPTDPREAIPDSRLRALARIAADAGTDGVAAGAEQLARRIGDGRYYVACVGQFKRGKSALLNALVGTQALPVGVVPVTSVITILRHGASAEATVHHFDGREERIGAGDLAAFVTEDLNPGNVKKVKWVEVFVPSDLLARGMCLVDTPGLGSVFTANTAVTEEFLPHVDAALAVIGADPPITGEELDAFEQVAANVRHLVFVLNKADRLPPGDADEGARFATKVLSERLRRPVGSIFQVSAVERIERGPTRDWTLLEQAVSSLARDAGSDLVREAEARGFERLVRSLLRDFDERRDALVRPVEESDRRIASLRKSVASGDQALADLAVLLAAEQARLARELRAQHEGFFPEAQARGRRALATAVRSLYAPNHRLRAAVFVKAREIALCEAERFRREVEPAGEELYRHSMARFVQLANAFLERLRASDEPGLDALPDAIGPEHRLRADTRLYYTDILDQTFSPLGMVLDMVRTRRAAVRAVIHRVKPYLDRLVETNSSRIANDLVERVTLSRAALERELRAALHEVTRAAERAVSNAFSRRREGEQAVRDELIRIETLRQRALSLMNGEPGATRDDGPRVG